MQYLTLYIIGSIFLAFAFSFLVVTEVLKKGNDQGDSTGDRFHYIVDFEITRQLDNVPRNFDDSTLGRPYNM